MEALAPEASETQDDWTAQFRQTLESQHGRVRAFLAAQRQRWQQIETQLRAEIERLAAEAESLRGRCAELEAEAVQPAQTALTSVAAEAAVGDDFRRRYEMALDDLRALKARNAQLERQVAEAAPPRPPADARPASGVLDWEAEKRRILAVLESDLPADGPRATERLNVEEVIRRTDQLLAEKDRQIAELQRLLAQHTGVKAAEAADAASATSAVLDHDTVVCEEREKLRQLQQQWQAKLRQAEIEISVERAKLARRQAEIEEKLRLLELQAGKEPAPADTRTPAHPPARDRWLTQLGLKKPR